MLRNVRVQEMASHPNFSTIPSDLLTQEPVSFALSLDDSEKSAVFTNQFSLMEGVCGITSSFTQTVGMSPATKKSDGEKHLPGAFSRQEQEMEL